jgi:hypothetical protein
MKIKLILTSLVAAFYFVANYIVNLIYSPVAGIATANQVNDSVSDYAWAKFVRDGGLQSTIFWVTIGLFVLIWANTAIKAIKGNNN